MKLRVVHNACGLPQVVTADGEVVEGVTAIETKVEVKQPAVVTVRFIDYELSRALNDRWKKGEVVGE